jgi:hypothetical protein
VPIWHGERQPDDAFMSALSAAVHGVHYRPLA